MGSSRCRRIRHARACDQLIDTLAQAIRRAPQGLGGGRLGSLRDLALAAAWRLRAVAAPMPEADPLEPYLPDLEDRTIPP